MVISNEFSLYHSKWTVQRFSESTVATGPVLHAQRTLIGLG